MSPVIIGIYLIVVMLLALALATKADHRAFVAILLVWLMSYPVLIQEEFMPRIAALNFDLQPTRIVLLILLPGIGDTSTGPRNGSEAFFCPAGLI